MNAGLYTLDPLRKLTNIDTMSGTVPIDYQNTGQLKQKYTNLRRIT